MQRGKYYVSHADSLMIARMAFAMSLPKRRVRLNKAGEWIAYEGRTRVYSFGSNATAAKLWEESDKDAEAAEYCLSRTNSNQK